MKKLTENEIPANHTGSAISGTNGQSDPSMPKSPILGKMKRRLDPLVTKIIARHTSKDKTYGKSAKRR